MVTVQSTQTAPDDTDDSVRLTASPSGVAAGVALLASAVDEALELSAELYEQLVMLLEDASSQLEAGSGIEGVTAAFEVLIATDDELSELSVSVAEADPGGTGAADRAPPRLAALDRSWRHGRLADSVVMTGGGAIEATIGLEPNAEKRGAVSPAPASFALHGPLFLRGVVPRALLQVAGDGSRKLQRRGELAVLGERIAQAILAEPDPVDVAIDASCRDDLLCATVGGLTETQRLAVAGAVGQEFPEIRIEEPRDSEGELVLCVPVDG